MENSDRELLEAILYQNQFIIKQNNFIIKAMDNINESLTFKHTAGYPNFAYKNIQEEAENVLDEINDMQLKLTLNKYTEK